MKDLDKVYDEFKDNTNMTADELEAWKDSDQFDAYEDVKSGGEDINEPVNDAIDLLETPKDEWTSNDVDEAEQLNSFVSRMRGVNSGDPIPGSDPDLSKRDASLINWGFDPNPGRKDFKGDKP